MAEYKYEWEGSVHSIKVGKGDEEGNLKITVDGKEETVPVHEPKIGFFAFMWSEKPHKAVVTREGETLHVFCKGQIYRLSRVLGDRIGKKDSDEEKEGTLECPISGKVVVVDCKEGDHIDEGQVVMILESMKMEYKIPSPYAGMVRKVNFAVESRVNIGELLIDLEPDEKDPEKRKEARMKAKGK